MVDNNNKPLTQEGFAIMVCRGLSFARQRREQIDLIPLKTKLDNKTYEDLTYLNRGMLEYTKREAEEFIGIAGVPQKYIDIVYSTDYGEASLKILKNELATLELVNKGIQVGNKADYSQVLEEMKDITQSISKKYKVYNQKESMNLEDIMAEDKEDEVYPFFSNGLNMLLQGIGKGEMYGIVCASGAGKSTYLAQEVKHIVNHGQKCCYIYTEMKQKDIFKNILTTLAGVNRRTIGVESIEDTIWEDFKNKVDIRRVDPQDLSTPDVVKNIVLDTEADVILLDYLKIPGTGEGNVDSARVQEFLEIIKSTCENNNKSFVFAMQATKSYFTLEERTRAIEFTANSKRAHFVCDGFMCIAPIGDEDDILDTRHGIGVDRSNIRSINIVKNRQRRVNGKGYEYYFVYEEFNPSNQTTKTLDIKFLNGKTLEQAEEFDDGIMRQYNR